MIPQKGANAPINGARNERPATAGSEFGCLVSHFIPTGSHILFFSAPWQQTEPFLPIPFQRVRGYKATSGRPMGHLRAPIYSGTFGAYANQTEDRLLWVHYRLAQKGCCAPSRNTRTSNRFRSLTLLSILMRGLLHVLMPDQILGQ